MQMRNLKNYEYRSFVNAVKKQKLLSYGKLRRVVWRRCDVDSVDPCVWITNAHYPQDPVKWASLKRLHTEDNTPEQRILQHGSVNFQTKLLKTSNKFKTWFLNSSSHTRFYAIYNEQCNWYKKKIHQWHITLATACGIRDILKGTVWKCLKRKQ